jgi:hypothetical protein
MAYPAYNQAVNIPTDADTTGKWKALYAGTGGTVKVDTFGGDSGVTFTMVAGGYLSVKVTKVYNSGTSITNGNLIGLN